MLFLKEPEGSESMQLNICESVWGPIQCKEQSIHKTYKREISALEVAVAKNKAGNIASVWSPIGWLMWEKRSVGANYQKSPITSNFLFPPLLLSFSCYNYLARLNVGAFLSSHYSLISIHRHLNIHNEQLGSYRRIKTHQDTRKSENFWIQKVHGPSILFRHQNSYIFFLGWRNM